MWAAIVFAALIPIYYFSKYQDLTVTYQSATLICGTQYTIQGAAYARKHPNIPKKDLVFDFGGKVADIWTEDSINRAHLLLGVIYSAGVGFLALALLTGLQESKESPPHGPDPVKEAPAA